jgi:hypothetical protein
VVLNLVSAGHVADVHEVLAQSARVPADLARASADLGGVARAEAGRAEAGRAGAGRAGAGPARVSADLGATRAEAERADADLVDADPADTGRAGAVDEEAGTSLPAPPPLAVWIPAALDPGPATLHQLRAQLAVYLSPPGYGEMFTALGHGTLVEQARAGKPRSELAQAIPADLIEAVGAIGSAQDITRRVGEYFDAGAGHVGLVPATAEDPAGRRLLTTLSPLLTKERR